MSKYLDTRDLRRELDDLETKRNDWFDDIQTQISDLEEEIEELEQELKDLDDENEDSEDRANLATDILDKKDEIKELQKITIEEFGEEDNYQELDTLSCEVDGWNSGVTLIPRDEFADYIKDMLEGDGIISRDLPWYIENAIDWSQVADNMESDYSTVDFRGDEYLYLNS